VARLMEAQAVADTGTVPGVVGVVVEPLRLGRRPVAVAEDLGSALSLAPRGSSSRPGSMLCTGTRRRDRMVLGPTGPRSVAPRFANLDEASQ